VRRISCLVMPPMEREEDSQIVVITILRLSCKKKAMVRNPLSKLPLSLCPARPLAGALSPTAPICGQQRAPRRSLTQSFRRQNLLQNRDNLTIVRTRPDRAETSGHSAAILLSVTPVASRSVPYTVCPRAPGFDPRGCGAVLRCRHGSGVANEVKNGFDRIGDSLDGGCCPRR